MTSGDDRNGRLAQLAERSFPRTRFREGYDMGDVERFIEDVLTRLRRDVSTVSVEEISDVRFTPVRLRTGYEMWAVDGYLDELIAFVASVR